MCHLSLLSGPVVAQQGAIAGRVTDATTLDPVPRARISVIGREPAAQVISEADGSFELVLDPGVHDMLVQADEFAPARFNRVAVTAGQTTTKNLPLESQGFRLAGFILTASRGSVDTEITAPSSSHSISGSETREWPAVSHVEHLRELSAVDIMTQGLQSSNLVVRGFNNIFSGALQMLADDRVAGLPALRVNLMHFLPSTDDDIERTEVVLGPSAALYGPNTANGVLQVITRSPLESPGTTVSVGFGERAVVQGAFRSAILVDDGFAVKLSGQLFQGDEWPHVDPVELAARGDVEADFDGCVADRQARGLTTDEARIACGRVGQRDDRIRRYAVEARADWRYSDRGTLVTTYGRTESSGIELTGLGAVQAERWVNQFVQARFTYDRWFVQTYRNSNAPGRAFMLRDGRKLHDRSALGVVQIRNGFSVAEERIDFTYGWDHFVTRPDTRGTVYGDFEDEDEITEWGAYLQSKIILSPTADLIGAGRIDSHSILPEKVFSPRLALVLKPSDNHAFRVAFNRAFSTPTTLNYFIDFGAGPAGDPFGPLGYTQRAFGSGRNGFAWQNADGTLRGMRSPFNPAGAGQWLPVDHPTLWQMGLAAADAESPIPQDVLAVLQGLVPGESDVDIMYFDVNDPGQGLRPITSLVLPDVPPVTEDNTETFEVGWSGVWRNRLRVSADAYYMRRNNFVTPLTVETPLLYLNGAELATWLAPAYVAARIDDLVDRLGLTVAAATAQATTEAAALAPSLASAVGQLPLAVASSDVPEMENGGADLIATYRNIGSIDLWGADLTLKWSMSPKWTLGATYSHVSKDWFRITGREPLALNAPANKATLGLSFRDEGRGLYASARARYTGSFPALATDYVGTRCIPDAPAKPLQEDCLDAYAIVDLALGYKIPRTRATVQLSVTNALDTAYRSFVGVPAVGRLAMVRVRYDLF